MKYLNNLINQRVSGAKIEQSHIGVITPYRKQVQSLIFLLRNNSWKLNKKFMISIIFFRLKSFVGLVIRKIGEKFKLDQLNNFKDEKN